MTRIFVYEFTCAAPAASLDAAGAVALNSEGEAMLAAVLDDLQRIPGVDAFTIRHERDEPAAFRAASRNADWTVVIAPEFNDILLTRCQWVIAAGSRLLGPLPDAVALCSDKLALARHLQQLGVATPETVPAPESRWQDYVVKPRFGAGSQQTLRNGPCDASNELGPVIAQPFIAGTAASVAFLLGPNRTQPLPPAEQILSRDGRFQYLGGRVPLRGRLGARAADIAKSAIDVVPGLTGYVGVDVVLGDDCDWVIEINPRLTTSYIGLRRLATFNLAEAMLRIAAGDAPPTMGWRDEIIRFRA